MGTSAPRNWRLTNCPKTTKMMLARPLMTNWRWLLEMTVLFCMWPPSSVYKSSHPCVLGEEVSLWADVCYPTPLVASIWSKGNFLFHRPGLFTGFWAAGSQTPHTCTLSVMRSLGWEDPLEEGMATHSSVLAWRIPGQRSLEGCSPWARKESDTTKQLTLSIESLKFLWRVWELWAVQAVRMTHLFSWPLVLCAGQYGSCLRPPSRITCCTPWTLAIQDAESFS